MTPNTLKFEQGFTLIEVAFVLVILTLLLGSILVPLGSAFEQSQRKAVLAQLNEINEALIGFAIAQGRLPCPATADSGGVENINDASTGECQSFHGFVPVADLGLVGSVNDDGLLIDKWNNPLRYSVTDVDNNNNGLNTHDFTFAGEMRAVGISNLQPDLLVCRRASTSATNCVGNGGEIRAERLAAVFFSMGPDWNNFQSDDQLENAGETLSGATYGSTDTGGVSGRSYPIPGNRAFVAKDYNQVQGDEKFDDIVIWLPANLLYARMIQGGALP